MPDHPYVAKPVNQSPLLEFLLGWFHPDWALDTPSESMVISRFLITATPSEVSSLVRDLDEVTLARTDPPVRDLVQRHMVNVKLGVAPAPAEPIVIKRRVSAFAGSDLDLLLRARDIDTLVLTGIAPNGVVLSTLRQAADLDYRLIVLSDGLSRR
jgi:isochorismate hydrolase